MVAYAAGLMGIEPPPETAFETAELSPMARSFYGENKRVSNAAIKATGYGFQYPDYRSALDAMWSVRIVERRGQERRAQPDEAVVIEQGGRTCYDSCVRLGWYITLWVWHDT